MDELYTPDQPKDFINPYQIIKYCIRPFENRDKPIERLMKGNIVANYTFEQLGQLNITGEVLLSWSAPVDLVEKYQIYIDKLNSSLKSEIFYKCEPLWFGIFCQYTFDSGDIFDKIVRESFDVKFSASDWVDDTSILTNITSLTCYLHLECNRGPTPICLDWREICNGQIDCIGSGIDEMNCFELEINECESNEYQCHNGMCIPEEFFNDYRYDLDCLDSTDEGDYIQNVDNINAYFHCYLNPSFRCEDAFYPDRVLDFACGDGQQVSLQPFVPRSIRAVDRDKCYNGRDTMLRSLILLDAEKTNLTYECWVLMSCLTYGDLTGICDNLCDGDYYCDLSIQSKCNASSYVIFPLISISSNRIQSGYWTARTISYSTGKDRIYAPDFFCYDVSLCPFFSPTFKIDNRTCVNHSDISLDEFNNPVRFFDRCLTIDKSGNETDCFHPSLFHCPGTSKCVSKRRLLDGFVDCYERDDETYVDSCKLNDKHRFRCSSENKCISNLLVRDNTTHCSQGEDEMKPHQMTLYYPNLCNGYTHMVPILTDGQNETDETNCEEWPCDNQYTRCDGPWTCHNGADEISCNPYSKCYPDHHECISPINFEVICLPINRSGDGKIDCLGASDERSYCQSLSDSTGSLIYYQCWNETKCTIPLCYVINYCSFENKTLSLYKCLGIKTNTVLPSLMMSFRLRSFNRRLQDEFLKYKHFTLYNSNSTYSLSTNEDIPDKQIQASVISDVSKTSNNIIDPRRHAWFCNRGILIYSDIEKIEHCLCPPAYYGNRCQSQNQRVSLTIKFSKECFPNCFGIYAIVVTLIDQNQVIHSYEQFTLQTTKNCSTKYNINLLYKSRPKDETINYTIYIHAYDRYELSYYTSWILPIKFVFLPVNRVAAHLIIPSHGNHIVDNCLLGCGDHGHCNTFVNSGKSFCRCDSGWSGRQCEILKSDCNCSPDSVCLDVINKRSICVCPISKYGPRCFLHSICQNDTCKNGGQCTLEYDQWSFNTTTCMCKKGFSGKLCETQDTRIDFLFHDIEIPQFLSVYFVTVQFEDDPIINMLSKKIPFDQDTTTLFVPLRFNVIFTRISNEYYLVYQEANASYLPHFSIEMQYSQRCSPVDELLDKRTLSFSLLRRAKYYHVACRKRPQLTCVYDLEGFMCLCDQERFANCLHFNFTSKPNCQQRSVCENDGECFPDRASCPTSTMCVCNKCYFGTKCQLTTKGFGLSLDTILGYQIRQQVSIFHQTTAIKVSITMTTLMFFIGLIIGALSTMTFSLKKLLEVGCGFYLRALSILSMISASILIVKLWLLIAIQSLWITNRVILWINCISMDFILRSLPAIGDWLSACVAVERTFVAIKGVNFNKNKSKQMARKIIIGVIIFTIGSVIHDPIHRRLIDDEEEKRTWCVVRYSSILQIFNSILHVFHFIIPFSINLISSIVIIISVARTHSNARKKQSYKQYLREQFHEHKDLIISPIILVILGVPRLILSFLYGCMESFRNPWLYLFGYFISFLPSLLIPIIFIIPSETYRKEFKIVLRSIRTSIRCR